MSSSKWHPFCLDLKALMQYWDSIHRYGLFRSLCRLVGSGDIKDAPKDTRSPFILNLRDRRMLRTVFQLSDAMLDIIQGISSWYNVLVVTFTPIAHEK